MKRKFTLLIAALALLTMIVQPGRAWGQAPVNTVLWSETWTGGTYNENPSDYGFEGTTVYNNATLTYSQNNPNTRVYNATLAGGTTPELLLQSGDSWTITNIPTGAATELTLTYKSNNTKSSVTCSTEGTTITGSSKSYTIEPGDNSAITLVFGCSGNTRIDDITLIVKTAGGGTPVETVATPTFDPAAGSYTEAQSVNISCETDGATIYYTTDGNAPTTSSDVYNTALSITETTTVKAMAVKEGMNNSAVATAAYTINTPYTGDPYVRITELSNLTDGATVIIAARYNSTESSYYAMTAATTGKPTGVSFTSTTSSNGECLPSSILNEEDTYSWTVGINSNGYTFTNANNQVLGYNSGTNFATGGNNTEWTITRTTAGNSAMVGGYQGFYIVNKNNTGRGIALNNQHNYGPYATSNNNSSDYNFYLDIFVQGYAPASVATPTFSPVAGSYIGTQNVTISCETGGSTIYYTTDGSVPSNQSTQYNGAITVSETTTIKAIAYVGSDASAVATATYSIVTPFTTMQAIFDDATTTPAEHQVYITFDNWVITGANTSQHAFLSDNTKGCIIYGTDHGFTAGDVLSGTAQCKIQLYHESVEITELTNTSTGLTVTPDGNVSVANIPMANLTGVNTGALVHYENLLCDARTEGNYTNYYLIDANNNEIQVYKTLLEDYAYYLEDGKTYNITGVFVLNNTTKRVNPRSADDIEEVIVVTPVISAENVEITYDATSGTITYEIENYVAGNMTASTEATWISDFTYQQVDEIGEVGFTTTENDGVARQATVTLTYTYNTNQTVTKNVTVSQAAAPVPSITVDPETITWNNSPINVELSQTITVSQANLTDDIEITTTIGAVDHTSIEAGAEATEITFTHTPTTAGDFEGTITLTSGTTVKEITVSGSAVEPSGESWVKVESADDLEVDGVYVIAATIHDDHVYNKVAGNISGQLLSCHTATFSANHDEITELPDEAIRFTLGGEEGAWTFANEDGDLLGSTAAKKMAWNNGTTTWDLSFEGNFVMANTTTSYGTLQYNYNGGSDRFTTYTSEQTPIQLYKLTSSNPRIVAQDVDLESSETEGTISYEVKNSVEGGELTASVPANSWITLGEVGDESIPFTCEANTGDERTETVTLTYTYNTNETVTKDITVTQAAYIAPVYGITIFTVLPQHVEVDVKDAQGENINTATEGTIVYLTAIPDECWEFTGWLVVNTTPDPSELVTVTDDHFTMPAGEVTVQALIEEKTLYTINYNSNGVTTSEQVCENPIAAEDLLTPDNVPAGFSFAGWTSDKATTDIVTSVTLSDEPTTLYAVFSIEEGGIPGDFVRITSTDELTDGEYLIVYEDENTANIFNGLSYSNEYVSATISNNSISEVPANAAVLTIAAIDEDSYSIQISTEATNNAGKYICGKSGSNTMNFESSAVANSISFENNDVVIVSDNTYLRWNNTSNLFRYYKSGSYSSQQAIQLYKKGADTPGTLAYYINVFQNETVEGDIIIDSKTVIPSGVILDMNGYNINNTEPENLVIEDGGQLIVNNSVAATVEKTIQASGSWGSKDGGVDGWDLISSPIGTVNTADVTNLTPAPVGTALQYDLYSYNEASKTWYNQQGTEHPFTQLMVGEGYLYSRKENADLGFAGEVSSASITKTLTYTEANGTLAGWNLVGNPYTHNITWANLEPTNVVTTGYYTLGYDGQWSAEPSTTTVIKPMQGFLVKANAIGANIVFNNTASSKSRANDDYIKFIVANSQYEDAAYAMFSENAGLDKINHRNADIPMLYIPQNDKNYAIATMDDNTQAFNLNFKAMTTGQYTLSFKAQGSYSYLHVIDRITGEDIDMLLDGEYTFIGSPRDNENRFIVKLNYNANIDELEAGDSFAYQYGNGIIVNGKGELQVFDVNGRMVMNTVINGKQTVNIPTTGLYIFRMVGESVKTQKIVVR